MRAAWLWGISVVVWTPWDRIIRHTARETFTPVDASPQRRDRRGSRRHPSIARLCRHIG